MKARLKGRAVGSFLIFTDATLFAVKMIRFALGFNSTITTRLSSAETQGQELARHVLSKDKYEYDVFLSHASEDKDEVARPLAESLIKLGLRVWYDEFEFRIGDNLIAKLNAGIDESRSGILILSKDFFGKNWTEHELKRLENLAVTDNRVLFPIWHRITEAEVREYRTSLADIFGRSTATHTLREIAHEIYEVISDFGVLDVGE